MFLKRTIEIMEAKNNNNVNIIKSFKIKKKKPTKI